MTKNPPVAEHGHGWRTAARRLAALGMVATGVVWFLDQMAAVAAVAAVAVAVVAACLVLARRTRQRGEDLDMLCEFLAAQTKGKFTVGKVRWQARIIQRITLAYAADLNDGDLDLRLKIEKGVAHKLDGRYSAEWDVRRNRVTFRRSPDTAVLADKEPDDEVVDPLTRTEQVIKTQFPAGAEITDISRDERSGLLKKFTIRYPTMGRDLNMQFRARVLNELSQKTPGGPYKARWDLERDRVAIEQCVPLPTLVPYDLAVAKAYLQQRLLPVAITEQGVLSWNTDRDTGTPHGMFVGTSGGGKTSLMRTVVIGALLLRWRVLVCDPKETEFVGFEGFPGVDAVGTTIMKMIAIINAAYVEMLRRNKVIKRAKRARQAPPPFEAILLVIDEFIDFKERVDMLWAKMKAEDKFLKGAEHPVLTRLRLLGVKARSIDIHLLFGSQRADVKFISGPMRDQMRFRASLMTLDQDGSRMTWGRYAFMAVDLPNIKGRSLISDALGRPAESQAFWVPDRGNYPALSEPERAFLDHVEELLADLRDRVPIVDLSGVVDDEDDRDDDDEIDAEREIARMDAVARLPQAEDDDVPARTPVDTQPISVSDVDPGMRVIVPGPDGEETEVEVVSADESVDDEDMVEIVYLTVESGEEGTYLVDRRDSLAAVRETAAAR